MNNYNSSNSPIKQTEKNEAVQNILNRLYISGIMNINESIINEFDANGEEKNIPNATDGDDGDAYTFDDDENNADATGGGNATTTDNNTGNQSSAEDQNNDTGENGTDQNTEDDEYNFDNNTEDDTQTQDDNTGEEDTGNTNQTDDNEDEYTLDDTDNQDEGEDGEDTGDGATADDTEDQKSAVNKIESELFEKLSPKQKEIKIKALKQNYLDLYSKCGDIIELVTNSTPGGEDETRIFDFVSKTVTELQENIHDYLTNTFGTKGYIDNDAQFKQYLVILDSIKKILDEFLNIDTDKKTESSKK